MILDAEKELAIQGLGHMITQLMNDEIGVTQIAEIAEPRTAYQGGSGQLRSPQFYTTKISWYYKNKKKPKKPQQIYKELFDKRYDELSNMYIRTDYSLERARIESNIYACANTRRVWREQFDKHN